MKPVDQTTFGFPGGNCFSACVASLLEIGIDEVPYFMGAPENEWFTRFREWLAPHGLWPLFMTLGNDGWTPDGLYIMGGLSPRGTDPERHLHSVVARGGEIVHDPHPSRAGLADRRDALMLVPVDPARARGLR